MQLEKTDTLVIAEEAGCYLSFPDVIALRDGRLLCAYRRADIHYPPTARETELLFTESTDGGFRWSRPWKFPYLPRDPDTWAWHCPRLSQLPDGRLCLACDCSAPGIGREVFISFSVDGGRRWSPPVGTGSWGIIPDRILQTGPDTLMVSSHYLSRKSGHLEQFSHVSRDGGEHWEFQGTIAHAPPLHLCEGSTVQEPDGRLSMYLRENSFVHHPTYVTRSTDGGSTWSPLHPHPTHGHRVCAGLLPDGDVLLTYRQVAGTPGLCAWKGSLDAAGAEIGGTFLGNASVEVMNGALCLSLEKSGWNGAEYHLPPLHLLSSSGEVRACLQVSESAERFHAALQCGVLLSIQSRKLTVFARPEGEEALHQITQLELQESDLSKGTAFIELSYSNSRFSISLDGKILARNEPVPFPLAQTSKKVGFGNASPLPPGKVGFEENIGESHWLSVSSEVMRESDPIRTRWNADSGKLPNHNQLSTELMLDTETSGDWYESGYSGWSLLGGNRVICVDYRRGMREKPLIVCHHLSLS